MRIFGVALILSCLCSSNLSYAITESEKAQAVAKEPLDPALEKNATGLEWLQMSMGERMDCILFSMVVLAHNGYPMNKTPNDYYDVVGEKLRLDPSLYSENITSILASIVKKRERG